MRYYSEDHVWVCPGPAGATLGLSAHAAAELGELTFVELPRPGTRLAPGDLLCVVESVKTAADVACPIHGVVTEVNHRLVEEPRLVNASPTTDGWICRLAEMASADLAPLLTEEEYEATVVHP